MLLFRLGYVVTPTLFDEFCQNMRRNINKDPITYARWTIDTPDNTLHEILLNEIGMTKYKPNPQYTAKGAVKEAAFLTMSGEPMLIDQYSGKDIPFFYFLPLKRNHVGLVREFGNMDFMAHYADMGELLTDIHKRIRPIASLYSYDEWDRVDKRIAVLLIGKND